MERYSWKSGTYDVIVGSGRVIHDRLRFSYSTINPRPKRLASFRLLVFARILSRRVEHEVTQQRVL